MATATATTATASTATATAARGDRGDAADDAQSNASSADHINDKAAGPPLTRRQKIRRHCGRFWLWYLVATIIFLAIFLPILFKVIIPAIVQGIINGQDLPIQGGRLDCLSASQAKIAINTSLSTPLPARIDNLTLSLYNSDTSPYTPFTNITIAGQKIKGDTKVIVPSQLVIVQNETELTTWFGKVIDSEKVDMSVKGNPTVFLGKLRSDVNLDKTLSMPGLKRFAGWGITELKIMLPPDKNGNNIKGTLNIPNASVLTLNFGNITFDVLSRKVTLGQITVYNLLLNVGSSNTLNFDGKLDLPHLVKNVGPVLRSQTDALNRGQVELNVTGTTVMANGQKIPYIENVLNKRQLTTSMSVITLLSNVASGLLGGGSASIVDVLGEVVGNKTFLQHVMDHYGDTQMAKNSTKSSFTKRAPDPKDAIMWNMLKMGLGMKLNQGK
ncbi:hypothetical protein EsDP_00004911 [Epichloe bromicola]|uniref:Uncharacterized protein n=1 Tax=Epichloe bromicola TaxID=79588 RepID=A0ABQ0CT75_9HYPO